MNSKLDQYLKEVKERRDSATEGPWGYVNDVGYQDIINEEGTVIANEVLGVNSKFIAHARQDVEALLGMVSFLNKELSLYQDGEIQEKYQSTINLEDLIPKQSEVSDD